MPPSDLSVRPAGVCLLPPAAVSYSIMSFCSMVMQFFALHGVYLGGRKMEREMEEDMKGRIQWGRFVTAS